jgi:hypothetical protein
MLDWLVEGRLSILRGLHDVAIALLGMVPHVRSDTCVVSPMASKGSMGIASLIVYPVIVA